LISPKYFFKTRKYPPEAIALGGYFLEKDYRRIKKIKKQFGITYVLIILY